MEARRARRREKKKQRMARQENIPCIVFLATDEESFELAEKKEDRQLRYINQYADAHGLIPMKIVRKSCFAPYVVCIAGVLIGCSRERQRLYWLPIWSILLWMKRMPIARLDK